MRFFYIFTFTFFISSHLLAEPNSSLIIRGGNDNRISINIKKVTGQDLFSFNTAFKLKKLIKTQLEDTQIFAIKNFSSAELKAQQNLAEKFSSNFFSDKPIYSELTILLNTTENNLVSAEITLYDLFTKENIIEEQIIFPKKFWYRGAAEISDIIYKYYTGLEGYINTRLVFVSEEGSLFSRKKKIALMDLYGNNLKYLTNSNDLVLTPRLSPNGKEVIYISYRSDFPIMYKLNLETMVTEQLFSSDQMIYAPRFSADGNKIVFAAIYDGNSEIITYDIKNRKTKRITNNYAIDTSPDFSPDGEKIIFSSDRSGRQKLYLINIDGTNLREINLGAGNYATPNWSPDGKYIAFTKIHRGKFHIAILNMENYNIKILTKSYKDESPSWSPNSKFIIFNRKKARNKNVRKGTSKLYMINLNGEIIQQVNTPYDASEADWVKIRAN